MTNDNYAMTKSVKLYTQCFKGNNTKQSRRELYD